MQLGINGYHVVMNITWLRSHHGMVAATSWHGRGYIMAWLRSHHGMVAVTSWHGRGHIMAWSRLHHGMVMRFELHNSVSGLSGLIRQQRAA